MKLTQSGKLAYMKMSERIYKRRKSLKLTQEAVAVQVGVNRVSVSNWETDSINGSMPSGKHLIKLAEALRVTPQWILSGDEAIQESKTNNEQIEHGHVLGTFELWDSKTPLGDDEVELPFYKEVELSAGNGSEVLRQDTGFKLRFAKSTLRNNNIQPDLAACVSVSGDSMQPVLPDKATVGIDTASTKIKDGEMYAIDHDGLLRVKILHRLPGGGIRIRSFNRDDYPDEDLPAEQTTKVRVLGRVFWYSVLR
ncbi:helix-turn-helix transcriptional regulator [Rheinheimera sp. MMS21-TC3]|uniref:helix-turn-helix transcriptional regulator n=1 Tax=Rheinheimera sp. MMS21-TC3 TaxID=3072790 RepID=UPI0028C46F19|nr:helix-turn-helix transcriptional regulator [Rheinheimera sp. MMS21-TC3]WNO60862.1 helix-turn-helix transcriptional regulator [Rheinheimera sp. MMS21-TC3]